ncbi:phosphodiesterase YaeI [Arcanobacterium haemolyticum]|uniref:metallophosphoesterase n=1 Tax=Arcanobacterium haemolyticum TaxID=28264 RepID=UPI000D96ED2E|nr:metallophosphoesterase [Arcanobacterium haemolyticum]SPT76052.1 phosphodiesterase YaeI [Arcanobacterium haemolyticum]
MIKRPLITIAGSLLAAGAGTLLGSITHAHAYRVRRRTVVVPSSGATSGESATGPLRILHISDTHLLTRQHKRRAFIRSLAGLEPDFVVLTGDLIAEPAAVAAILTDFGPLLNVPGAFVFGSNDYHGPRLKNPFVYIGGNTGKTADTTAESGDTSVLAAPADAANHVPDPHPANSQHLPGQPLPTDELRAGLTSGGWIDLNNARAQVAVNGWELDLVGIDDPHIGLDRMPEARQMPEIRGQDGSAGQAEPTGQDRSPGTAHSTATAPSTAHSTATALSTAHLKLALAHAPYTWVLDMMQADGANICFSGHTHGGQVNLPGSHALVTNCDLDCAYAKGLFEWSGTGSDSVSDQEAPTTPNAPTTPAAPGDSSAQSRDRKPSSARVIKKDGSIVLGNRMLAQISAGIGTSPFTPVRTFCAPEAIILDVVAAPGAAAN